MRKVGNLRICSTIPMRIYLKLRSKVDNSHRTIEAFRRLEEMSPDHNSTSIARMRFILARKQARLEDPMYGPRELKSSVGSTEVTETFFEGSEWKDKNKCIGTKMEREENREMRSRFSTYGGIVDANTLVLGPACLRRRDAPPSPRYRYSPQ
ncbi:hypothetical protein Syun_000667 [Stephania yunnanensis]|uniref:Uncharacterized protein n=1 Tax=Stephania yunnanensis TaxID=152371 RepID=A0AAP0LE39_9MAGN